MNIKDEHTYMPTINERETEKRGRYWRERGKNGEERGETQGRESSCRRYSCVAIMFPKLGILSWMVLNTDDNDNNTNHKLV